LEEAPSALCSWRLAAAAPRAGAGSWAAAAHHPVARRLGDEGEQQLRLVEEVDGRELLGVEDADLAVRLAGGGGGTVRRWCGVTCAWAWYGRNAASVEAAGCDLVTWKVALMRIVSTSSCFFACGTRAKLLLSSMYAPNCARVGEGDKHLVLAEDGQKHPKGAEAGIGATCCLASGRDSRNMYLRCHGREAAVGMRVRGEACAVAAAAAAAAVLLPSWQMHVGG